mgnify:CR=1 FL=1
MPQIIIHENGVFNLFSTVVDAPIFNHGIKEADLLVYLYEEGGRSRVEDFIRKRERIVENGSFMSGSVKEVVMLNCAGKNEENIDYETFMSMFMTIPENYASWDFPEKINEIITEYNEFNERYGKGKAYCSPSGVSSAGSAGNSGEA